MVDLLMADLLRTYLQKMHSTRSEIKPDRSCLRYHHHDFEISQQMSSTSWNDDSLDFQVGTSVEQTVLLRCEGLQAELVHQRKATGPDLGEDLEYGGLQKPALCPGYQQSQGTREVILEADLGL